MQWRKKYTRPLSYGQPRPRAFFPLRIAVCAILATVLVPNFAEGQVHTWTYSADAEETFGNALEAYQQGRFDEALNHLRQLAEFPDQPAVQCRSVPLGEISVPPRSLCRSYRRGLGLAAPVFPSVAICPNARLLIGDSFFQ